MLKEQRQFRRALFFAALSLELVLLALMSQRGSILSIRFLILYPLSLLLIVRPFDFFKEFVEIRDNHVVRVARGKVIELMPLNELVSQETHSILGFIPILTLFSEKKRMDIPFMLRGTLELEKKLYGVVPFDEKSERFFSFAKTLLEQNRSLWHKMTLWFHWFYLFAVITPFLLWEHGAVAGIYWIFSSLFWGVGILILFKVINHFVCLISLEAAQKFLPAIEHWGLFVAFLLYLQSGFYFFNTF